MSEIIYSEWNIIKVTLVVMMPSLLDDNFFMIIKFSLYTPLIINYIIRINNYFPLSCKKINLIVKQFNDSIFVTFIILNY